MRKKILLVTLFAIGLTSCSKDDDSSNESPAAFEGKWAYSKTGAIVGGQELLSDYHNECTTKKDYIEFKTGGVADDVYYPGDCIADVITGTWSKSGNNVTVDIDGIAEPAEIITLTSTTLKVKYDDEGTTKISVYSRL